MSSDTSPRVLFAGSPAITLPALETIANAAKAGSLVLAGVLTNPDKAKGRSGRAEPCEVCRRALSLADEFTALGLEAPAVLRFDTLRAEAREAVAALKPDLLVSFAYGKIFGPRFMALFRLGGINIHPSLLPKYRGASPIQEAILRRDTETGVSIQRIAAEMDAGNILARKIIPLNGRETTSSLGEIAADMGAELLCDVLEQFRGGAPEGRPQQGEPSYCTLIQKEFGIIDWKKSAPDIDAHIRACNPWPLARTYNRGQPLNILEASVYEAPGSAGKDHPAAASNAEVLAGGVLGIDKKSGILIQTGDGILAVSLLQYQSKKALSWRDFLNGARDFIGSCLASA